LKEYTRDAAPRYWAGIQINIATTLDVLGERTREREKLEQAAEAIAKHCRY